ncbi:MAG: hypothetical protein KKD44_26700 [Proteobacteria bacterium]|nr:hypothetical protein [Pseudomonadota bacterium]
MANKASFEEMIAEEHVAPTILELLKPYSVKDMAQAISENVNLAKGLQQNPQYLNQIKLLLMIVPDPDKLAKKIKQKKWIDWFIDNAMKHKRPDLYRQIIYSSDGKKYIARQVRHLIRLIFD